MRNVRRSTVHVLVVSALVLPLLAACASGVQPAPMQTPVPRAEVWECFRLNEPLDEPPTKFLSTRNFGIDQVRVLRARWLCEEAVKSEPTGEYPAPQPPPRPRVHECFDVRVPAHTTLPERFFTLTTRNFGAHPVVTHAPEILCEEAGKGDSKEEAKRRRPARPQIHECYEIEGPDPNQPKRLATRNFGPDDVEVRKARFLCEEAGKGDTREEARERTPQGQPEVYECFDLLRGLDPPGAKFLSTHNFGTHRVDVGRAEAMCERAVKAPRQPPPPYEER